MSDTKTVVSVTERATKAVTAAAGNLSKVVTELLTLAEGSEQISQEIQFKQKELSQIDTQYDEKLAEAKSALKIKTLENEDAVVNNILKSRGLVSINPQEVSQLRTDLATALESNEDAVSAAVSAAQSASARELQSRLSSQESTHKIAIAELNAGNTAKDSRIKDLEAQVTELREQIKAERDTRLEIAKADAQRAAVVVQTGKQ
ncbi:hypothetical protein pEaSNUABM56_00161 [Erwinia phage pEa_SNUABM_56]|uniref:Myosin tail containing protein n=1 Tax=Erwinia phage pEp_SNUABM_01 TaxID=2601643 RepID=A0A5J6DAN3_9CAUD|nr:myosin tail containing protein [Erwinia phage pEp_SNUABM_01]QEQ94939.1 myosin tail containing protein [Erwinia phage pEp_SNUABM_01]UYL85183.1 hypothetical protein pEaSNUABM56_00161 [Erwinia phage pEa_SNUABM_56]